MFSLHLKWIPSHMFNLSYSNITLLWLWISLFPRDCLTHSCHEFLLISPENIRKPEVFWYFRGVSNEISSMNWVKSTTHIIILIHYWPMVCSYRNQLIDLQLTNQSSCFSIRRTLIANELIVENEIRWLMAT